MYRTDSNVQRSGNVLCTAAYRTTADTSANAVTILSKVIKLTVFLPLLGFSLREQLCSNYKDIFRKSSIITGSLVKIRKCTKSPKSSNDAAIILIRFMNNARSANGRVIVRISIE